MNWTYTDCNSSREIPRYICISFLLNLKNKFFKIFFSFIFFQTSLLLPHYSSTFIFIYFYDFFQLGKKFFLFSFFFCLFCFVFLLLFILLFFLLFSFLSFLLLVFLSYFLLKSSNTPLLFLNFHFHLTITLQKKKET